MRLSPDQRLFGAHETLPSARQSLMRLSWLIVMLGLNLLLPRLPVREGMLLGGALLSLGAMCLMKTSQTLERPLQRALWMLWGLGALQALLVGGLLLLLKTGPASMERDSVLSIRLLNALTWLLWFGAKTPWPALKQSLRGLRVPKDVLLQLELLLAHGLSLARSLERRLSAARVRHAYGPGRPLLRANGQVLAGGLLLAVERAIQLEQARQVRSAGAGPVPSAMLDGELGRIEEKNAPPGWAWRPEALKLPGEARSAAREDVSWGGLPLEGERMPSVLRLEQVSVQHEDGTLALEGLNLTLERGGWVVLAGPSGSGKSSLLKLLAGLLSPQRGRLERLGRVVPLQGAARFDRRVALVFQNPEDQLFGATPLEDLLWGLEQVGVPLEEAHVRAQETLAALGLERLAHRPVHRLSFGEQKRVAFAAALVTRPALLLCDEPTSGLDPVSAAQLLAVLERETRAETAVIWATHELSVLPARSERVWLLREGRCVAEGGPALLGDRRVLYAAGLCVTP